MPSQQMQLSLKHIGETQKTKEFNPVFYPWVPLRQGMDTSTGHKPAQQMTGWGWGDVVMCFLGLLLTFSFPPSSKWGRWHMSLCPYFYGLKREGILRDIGYLAEDRKETKEDLWILRVEIVINWYDHYQFWSGSYPLPFPQYFYTANKTKQSTKNNG